MDALTVTDLRISAGRAELLRGVSLSVAPGERLGLVGESGSGKSITALGVMGLLSRPARVAEGSILLAGTELVGMRRRELDAVRGARIAMIYQDPGAALNPLMTIGEQLREAILLHEGMSRQSATARAAALLEEVGLANAGQILDSYPHEFSGGMRQRVMIAMALSCEPDVLICDEPTTALDVTTQARVMALIDRLCRDRGTAVVLITHDLGIAAGFCDRIAVMYAGQLVEVAQTDKLFARPRHPYTRALLDAALDVRQPIAERLPAIAGGPPSPESFDEGCAFRDRCAYASARCASGPIPLRESEHGGVRCVRVDELDLVGGEKGFAR